MERKTSFWKALIWAVNKSAICNDLIVVCYVALIKIEPL